MAVILPRFRAVLPRRDHRLGTAGVDGADQGIAVVALVRDDHRGLVAVQQHCRSRDVRLLSRRQLQRHRQTQAIDGHMNLRGKTAAGPAQRFALLPYAGSPFFAPAASWWARTTVLSSSSHS